MALNTDDKTFYKDTTVFIRLGRSPKGNRDRYVVELIQGFSTFKFDVATSSPVGLIIKGLLKWFRSHVMEVQSENEY